MSRQVPAISYTAFNLIADSDVKFDSAAGLLPKEIFSVEPILLLLFL
jgi:hypothetical protein